MTSLQARSLLPACARRSASYGFVAAFLLLMLNPLYVAAEPFDKNSCEATDAFNATAWNADPQQLEER